MTGYINRGFNPVSALTLAGLQDLGYSVNPAAADEFDIMDLPQQLPGAGKGSVTPEYGDGIIKGILPATLLDDGIVVPGSGPGAQVTEPEDKPAAGGAAAVVEQDELPLAIIAGAVGGVVMVAGVALMVVRKQAASAAVSKSAEMSAVGSPSKAASY